MPEQGCVVSSELITVACTGFNSFLVILLFIFTVCGLSVIVFYPAKTAWFELNAKPCCWRNARCCVRKTPMPEAQISSADSVNAFLWINPVKVWRRILLNERRPKSRDSRCKKKHRIETHWMCHDYKGQNVFLLKIRVSLPQAVVMFDNYTCSRFVSNLAIHVLLLVEMQICPRRISPVFVISILNNSAPHNLYPMQIFSANTGSDFPAEQHLKEQFNHN